MSSALTWVSKVASSTSPDANAAWRKVVPSRSARLAMLAASYEIEQTDPNAEVYE